MPDPATVRRRLIEEVLSRAARTSHAVGGATRAALATFSTELATLIGQRAVRSLYDRSLHLASARFAWLAPNGDTDTDEPFAELQGKMTERSVDEALEAGVALLVEYTSLLAVLIGEALTERLMRKAWYHAQENPSSENPK